eukprot:scaffold147904_cov15-Prasinocladus_malaysianus.AAC.1
MKAFPLTIRYERWRYAAEACTRNGTVDVRSDESDTIWQPDEPRPPGATLDERRQDKSLLRPKHAT